MQRQAHLEAGLPGLAGQADAPAQRGHELVARPEAEAVAFAAHDRLEQAGLPLLGNFATVVGDAQDQRILNAACR